MKHPATPSLTVRDALQAAYVAVQNQELRGLMVKTLGDWTPGTQDIADISGDPLTEASRQSVDMLAEWFISVGRGLKRRLSGET